MKKPRHETVGMAVKKAAFSGNADCREDVVACYHHGGDVGVFELLQHFRCAGLQLVLENDEADEIKIPLNLGTSHLLRLYPAESVDMSCSTSDDAVASVSVV